MKSPLNDIMLNNIYAEKKTLIRCIKENFKMVMFLENT